MIRRPPRSTLSSSSAASDVYKRQVQIRAGVRNQYCSRTPARLVHPCHGTGTVLRLRLSNEATTGAFVAEPVRYAWTPTDPAACRLASVSFTVVWNAAGSVLPTFQPFAEMVVLPGTPFVPFTWKLSRRVSPTA